MATLHDSIFSSPPFKFLVGPDQKLFIIHSGLIANHSKPLSRLVNGEMSEAKEECARLEDVDEGTFGRYIRYAYTGDYLPAEPDILLDPSLLSTTQPSSKKASRSSTGQSQSNLNMGRLTSGDEVEREYDVRREVYDEWGLDTRIPKSKKGKMPESKKGKLWREFKERSYYTPIPLSQPQKSQKSCEDYTEVFLCHARLYIFAEKYDIAHLCQLSLQKLHRTLTEFTLYDDCRRSIIEPMRYTYLNTPDLSESIDPLRSLVIHYAAYVVEKLAKSDDFQALLEELGQVGRDLVLKILERID